MIGATSYTTCYLTLYTEIDNFDNYFKNFHTLGFTPSTDMNRNFGGAQKFFTRYILHGMLRFTKMTRTINQAAMAVCALVTDEKYKGKHFFTNQKYKGKHFCMCTRHRPKIQR